MNYHAPLPNVGTPPDRSLEQRMDALGRANVKRTHRSRVKRDLKARRVSLAVVLDDPLFDTCKVFDVIRHLPLIGQVKALKLIIDCEISPAKTCEHITPRQRRDLFRALGPLTQRQS